MPCSAPSYIGRFAPSPSGPLHFGSLIAATGSYLQAKSQQGQWLVRMEDIDLPRMVQGADSDILRTLELFGLYWDGDIWYQSARLERYQQLLDEVRLHQAIHWLQFHGDSPEQICRRLNFSDPTNFRRSFKRWCGLTPSACRQSLLATMGMKPGG